MVSAHRHRSRREDVPRPVSSTPAATGARPPAGASGPEPGDHTDPDQGTGHDTGHDEGREDDRDPGGQDGGADEGGGDTSDGDAGDGDASAAPSDGRPSPDASAAPPTGRDPASTGPSGSEPPASGDASLGPVAPEGRPPWGGSRDHAEAGRLPDGHGWNLPGHPPVPLLPSGGADGGGRTGRHAHRRHGRGERRRAG